MARCPDDGWRWQAQPEAQSPRPQPEMTTVRPSSRTLPTWKTDGLRLLLTESSPRQPAGADPGYGLGIAVLAVISAELGRFFITGSQISCRLHVWRHRLAGTESNSSSTRRRRQFFPCRGTSVGGTAPSVFPWAPRTSGGLRRASLGLHGPQLAGLTLLMLKSGTRNAGIAVRVNQSFHSRGSVRSVRLAWTARPSRSTGDSLNR